MATNKRGLGEGATTALRRRPAATAVAPTSTEGAAQGGAAGGVVAALAATQQREEGTGGVTTVQLAEVAEHPDNPRVGLTDLDGLAASIKETGLLQPIVVAPASDFLVAHPQHVDAVGSAQWVLLAGHRRRAAALLAGVSELPAMVRADLAGAQAAAKTLVIENIHRQDLGPLEEGRAFSQLAAMGMSQRQIAKETGVSQSHISKRLALTKLPEGARSDLASGSLTLGDAISLTTLPGEEQESAYKRAKSQSWLSVPQVVREVTQRREQERNVSKARRQIEDEGLRLVVPAEEWGANVAWKHLLDNDDAVTEAREAGTLVAAANTSGVLYYTTAGATPGDRAAVDGALEAFAVRTAREAKERKAAIKARTTACARLVAVRPSARQAITDLARSVLHHRLSYAESLKLVHDWLGDTVGDKSATSAYVWCDSLRDAEPGVQTWVAWAMTVASDEEQSRWGNSGWDRRNVEHLDRLIAAGYEPTEWEQARLTAARLAMADAEQLPGQTTVHTARECPDGDAACELCIPEESLEVVATAAQ